MYRLTDFLTGAPVDLATEVVGYLFQALGLLVFALAVHSRPGAAGSGCFALAVGADMIFIVLSVLSRGLIAALAFGYGMNTLHGVIAGYYLYRLALAAEQIRFDGDRPSPSLVVLAALTVLLLSLVKNLGFGFPAADVERGISLELSRVFYAVGLAAAGFISDRERKYGAVCCVASLCIPFLMIALSDSIGTSIVLWILNYLFFGFFTVFRVVLFSDISRKDAGLLYLSGFGLLFGRLGDAAGAYGCIALSADTVALVVLAAALFAVTVLSFFPLYQRIYLPSPIREKSEQELFDSFAERYDLSAREREILRLILAGQSSSEIAEGLYVSPNTVKYHVRNLLRKTECENRVSLVALYRAT